MLKDRNCGGNLQYVVYVSWDDCIKKRLLCSFAGMFPQKLYKIDKTIPHQRQYRICF